MVGHDDVRALANEEAIQVHPKLAQALHLGQQSARVHHHAVADDAGNIRMQDARRHEMKRELLVAVDHPVPGVAAALIAHHIVRAGGQLVNDLALAFVAPLGAHHRHHAHGAAFL